ncbi:MAG: DNA-binding response regulator [Anaerocolumna sp.]|jgi:DNA-binding LytR/AlgR family response regulator|nr:DNA-binding response regulator [Anaerocolumna sp.]
MYNIAICDDDPVFINYLKKMLITCGLEERMVMFYEFCTGEDLILCMSKNIEYDLLILDMQMGVMDGNETAKLYREKYINTIIVFCSGSAKPTVKSFEVTPFRYLLKQYSDTRMQREMCPIIDKIKSTKLEPFIVGSYLYNTIKLTPEEILYIAVSKHGSNIYLCSNIIHYDFERNIKSKKKLNELYTLLKYHGFVYAHNSYIVNLKYIKRKTTNELELADGTVLSISRSKEKELRKTLAIYLAQKYE